MNLENLRELPKPGALGEQQRGWALTGNVIQVEFEPDGANLRNGWADVLEDRQYQSIIKQNINLHPTISSDKIKTLNYPHTIMEFILLTEFCPRLCFSK